MGGVVNNCDCSHHGQILTLLNISVQEQRNPLRVAEADQTKVCTYRVIVPGHPDRLPGAGRIIAHIYVLGGQAEHGGILEFSKHTMAPLIKNVPLAQGIALLKINAGFSCNSREV